MRENNVWNTFFLHSFWGIFRFFKVDLLKEVPLFQKNFLVYSGPRCKEEPQKKSGSSCFSFTQKPNLRYAIKLCPQFEIFAFFREILTNGHNYFFTNHNEIITSFIRKRLIKKEIFWYKNLQDFCLKTWNRTEASTSKILVQKWDDFENFFRPFILLAVWLLKLSFHKTTKNEEYFVRNILVPSLLDLVITKGSCSNFCELR